MFTSGANFVNVSNKCWRLACSFLCLVNLGFGYKVHNLSCLFLFLVDWFGCRRHKRCPGAGSSWTASYVGTPIWAGLFLFQLERYLRFDTKNPILLMDYSFQWFEKCLVLYYTALRYTALHCTSLHNASLHFYILWFSSRKHCDWSIKRLQHTVASQRRDVLENSGQKRERGELPKTIFGTFRNHLISNENSAFFGEIASAPWTGYLYPIPQFSSADQVLAWFWERRWITNKGKTMWVHSYPVHTERPKFSLAQFFWRIVSKPVVTEVLFYLRLI